MQIKALDDRQGWLDELHAMLARRDLAGPTRERIEQEIRAIKAGLRAEKDAAYQIEFYAAKRVNVMTLHSLRVQSGERVAQIDHLIITRPFDVWVCESKRFSESVEINDHGEWIAYYGGRPRGLPSPIEQNRRHAAVLSEVFETAVTLPTRGGRPIRPTIKTLVLISDRAHIKRPTRAAAERIDGLDTVIKADQLKVTVNAAYIERMKSGTPADGVLADLELKDVASQLARLHVPSTMDWPRRFGLPAKPLDEPRSGWFGLGRPAKLPRVKLDRRPPECFACGDYLSTGVVAYCRDNADVFDGRLFCIPCQDEFFPYY